MNNFRNLSIAIFLFICFNLTAQNKNYQEHYFKIYIVAGAYSSNDTDVAFHANSVKCRYPKEVGAASQIFDKMAIEFKAHIKNLIETKHKFLLNQDKYPPLERWNVWETLDENEADGVNWVNMRTRNVQNIPTNISFSVCPYVAPESNNSSESSSNTTNSKSNDENKYSKNNELMSNIENVGNAVFGEDTNAGKFVQNLNTSNQMWGNIESGDYANAAANFSQILLNSRRNQKNGAALERNTSEFGHHRTGTYSKGMYSNGSRIGNWYNADDESFNSIRNVIEYKSNGDKIVYSRGYNNYQPYNLITFAEGKDRIVKYVANSKHPIEEIHYFDNKEKYKTVNENIFKDRQVLVYRKLEPYSKSDDISNVIVFIHYFNNGEIHKLYNSKKSIDIEYYAPDKPKFINRIGENKSWYKNGQLEYDKTIYKNDTGLVRYYKNGNHMFKIPKGLKNGETLEIDIFKPDGSISHKESLIYLNGILKYDFDKNKKVEIIRYENDGTINYKSVREKISSKKLKISIFKIYNGIPEKDISLKMKIADIPNYLNFEFGKIRGFPDDKKQLWY